MPEKIKNIIKNLLFAFLFLSIGFSIGKELTKRSFQEKILEKTSLSQKLEGTKIIVYYMHSTFRCATCNKIERLTEEVLNKNFAESLKNGSIEFKSVNFQKDEELAKKYKIATGCVVVAKIANGKDIAFKVLEDVWTLYNEPDKFNEYVSDGIREIISK
ncbi:MAG TPA: nitrophenyl compound nitroreductase subunit ArsF family protein [Victivallales bacterium]|nr:nitrophenyl compound nitroreductase subunit ArsF family protein [Victivallales bacterium]HRU02025.1 nitrophenyl compound nitroreductase subunit ArsF family protein [Victivallales bacterium]